MTPAALDLIGGAELGLRNLVAWSLQLALVAWSAALLALLLPLERPEARLRLWQTLLLAALVLPALQPWRATVAGVDWSLGLASEAVPQAAHGGLGLQGAAAPPWILLLTVTLLAGTTLQLGRLALGLARLRGIRRRARPLDPPAWLHALRARLAPDARFVMAAECGGPATFGVVRPTIVLPPEYASMPVARQRAVALHELTHARRHDWLALLGEELLRALLFFHPAVHWLVGRIRLAREQCVDAEVVRSLGGRRTYLESLVEVARLNARTAAVPAAPFLREHHLRERVELLMKEVPMSRVRSLVHLGITVGGLVLAGTLSVAAFPLAVPPAEAATAAALDDATPASPAEPDPFPAKKIGHVNPVYPKGARDDGAQGTFILAVKIDEEGRVADARVIVSSPSSEPVPNLRDKEGTPEALQGDERLAQAALDAVRQWRYEPVLGENGEPKEVDAILTVRFRLS